MYTSEYYHLKIYALLQRCSPFIIIILITIQTVEIVLIDVSEDYPIEHPLHMHGHTFSVLAQGGVHFGFTKEQFIQMDESKPA